MTTLTAPTPTTRSDRLPLIVPLLTVGTFLMITTEYMVAGLLPQMAADLNVSIAQVGLLITAFAGGMIVGSPIMALATRKLPHRATLILALIIYALGHAVAALSTNFSVVLAGRVVTAVAAGAFWAVASAVATTAAGPAKSSRALGVMMTGVGLATVAGVPLGSFAGQLLGWRSIFWALAVLAILVVPVIAKFTPTTEDHAMAPMRTELRAIASGRMVILVIATILATGGGMTVFSYLSPLAGERAGIPAWAVPLVFVTFGIGSIIGSNTAGRFADRRPLTTFITATAASAVLIGLLMPLSASAAATFGLTFLLGAAGMGIPPVGTGLAVRFASAAPALAAAVAVAAFNGGTAIGTWAGAIVLETPLGVTGPLIVALSMSVLGVLTLVLMAARRVTSHRPATAAGH
ncbi:MFS transporter [Arthrobacter sp. NPDC057009]|uniref:MFS transporter n=1 Tax=Arthrobacter sp. NPDC057009 TaxID=3345996 RepID=UPI00363620B1